MVKIRGLIVTAILIGCFVLSIWYSQTTHVFYNRNILTFPQPATKILKTHFAYVANITNNKNVTIYSYKENNDTDCAARKMWKYKPMINDLPLTALASPWRSGNTWIRHLLQMATGIGTTSQYCDAELKRTGFPFECVTKSLSKFIVRKTHMPNPVLGSSPAELAKQNYQRAVLVIRDPYTFIVANVYSDHLSTVPESTYFTERFRNVTQPKFLNWWNVINKYWLNEFKGLVYPVLYTNFLNDVEKELRKLLTFLGVKFSISDIECAVYNTEGNFHRKARMWTRIKSIKELFSYDMQRQIDFSVKYMSEILLKKYGVTWVNDTYNLNQNSNMGE